MSELSEADRYLLDQIQSGNSEGWSQLIDRYQGRLLAFARSHLASSADAEDAVQETLISFLKGLKRFRRQSSIESYLFSILRHKVVDQLRRRAGSANMNSCSLQDTLNAGGKVREPAPIVRSIPSETPTGSWYARRAEDRRLNEAKLWVVLQQFVESLKKDFNFRDLILCELIFYAQLRNKDIAMKLGMDEKQVALRKHRFIKRIGKSLDQSDDSTLLTEEPALTDDAALTRFWELNRPSCPKRSTIGKYLLGTLEEAWHDYVDFHLNSLGCRFCRANLDDLQFQTKSDLTRPTRDRIFQSTIGFLQRS